jgi:hypothetical protein
MERQSVGDLKCRSAPINKPKVLSETVDGIKSRVSQLGLNAESLTGAVVDKTRFGGRLSSGVVADGIDVWPSRPWRFESAVWVRTRWPDDRLSSCVVRADSSVREVGNAGTVLVAKSGAGLSPNSADEES